MRHQDEGSPTLCDDTQQEVHNFDARALVQISRRLVGEDDRWLINQSPGDGDPLAFAARKTRREMIETIDEAYLREQFTGGGFGWAGINPGNAGRQRNILQRREFRHQLVILKDETDASPKGGARSHETEPRRQHAHLTDIRLIETAEQL